MIIPEKKQQLCTVEYRCLGRILGKRMLVSSTDDCDVRIEKPHKIVSTTIETTES
jgi:hypothetical protein